MQASDKTLKAHIVRDEGFRSEPYKDTVGVWTIGYGSNMHHLPADDLAKVWQMDNGPRGITEEQANVFLLADLRHTLNELAKFRWWDGLSRNRQLALANMAYQLGVPGLRKFKRTLRYIALGNFDKAADEALDSLWARQTPNRAKRVTDMLRAG